MNTTHILGRLAKALGWLVLVMVLTLVAKGLFRRFWDEVGPPRERLSEVRRTLVQRWLPEVLADLKTARGQHGSVLIPHLEGDPTSEVTDALRDAIRQSGVLWVNPRSFQSVIREATEDFHRALRVRVNSPDSLRQALAWSRGLDVDTVLFGRVHRLEGDAQSGRLEVELCLADTASGAVLHVRRYGVTWVPAVADLAVVGDGIAGWTPGERFLAWVCGGLLLPVLAWPVVRAVVRRRSNGASAWLLGALTAGQAAGAWLLLGVGMGSLWGVALLTGLVALAFYYNLRVLACALD